MSLSVSILRRCTGVYAAALFLVLLTTCVGNGQTFMSSINGTITDPSGSAVPAASVEIRNLSTNDVRRTTSGADGSYEFPNLLPGTYELSVQAGGFKKFVRSDLVLRASIAASLDAKLEVGATQETVQVTGEAVLLDTETANHAVTLNTNLVAELPVNTRSPLSFVFALAGTTEAQGGMTSRSANIDQMFSMFGLQGGRSGNAQILIDGGQATAVDWGGLMVSPTISAIQEMQVIQNTYDAQYGKSGAGVVTLISKGGTTAFHGGVYDYLRNDNLDANWWSNNKAGIPRGEFKRNQFGAFLGGPILKRYNLFFFGSYEGLREPRTDSSGFWTVPTELERRGDFSRSFNEDGTPIVVYNPFTTRALRDANGDVIGYTRDPFPGNRIPQELLNAVGQRILNLYPLPNRPGQGANGVNNFFAQGQGRVVNDKYDARIDWAQNEKHRLFGRISHRVRQNNDPACFICNGADPAARFFNPGFQFTINDTVTPSPNWVINGLIGASRWQEGQTSLAYGRIAPGDLGLRPADYQAPVIPTIGIDNFSGIGNNGVRRLTRYAHTAQANITRQLSSHTLTFGGNFDVSMMNNLDQISGGFGFGRGMTSCDPAEGGGPCRAQIGSAMTGSGVASLLLGVGGGSTQIRPDKAMSLHFYGLYLQDAWRVTPKLTLNLGLRYENQRPATERYNRISAFDPNLASPIANRVNIGRPLVGGVVYANDDNRGAWVADNKNFAPRIGVAYKVTDRLVARAGAGIFYLPASAMISYDDGMFIGFGTTTQWIGTQSALGYIPTNTLSNIYPSGVNPLTGSSLGPMTQVGQGISQIWPVAPHPTGYTSHFSFDIQYDLGRNSVLEVGYVGWRGRKMMYGEPLPANQMPTEHLKLGEAELMREVPNPFFGVITDPNSPLSGPTVLRNQLLRPFPQFSYIDYARSLPGARADFNALTLKYTLNFRGGLNMISTYQFSKTKDNASEDFIGWIMGGSWRDAYNTMLDYSISSRDIPHSFATALVYRLPFGKGQRWGADLPSVADHILGGWETSTIVRLQTGMPLWTIQWNRWWNPLWQYGFPGPQRANLVGDPKPANQTPDNWINREAFAEPGPTEYGNTPRYMDELRESATRNVDLAVSKNFKAGEAFRIQFRAEFLNLFNTPQFGGGNQWGTGIQTCITCGQFGEVFGTRNEPRNIQMGLRVDFDD